MTDTLAAVRGWTSQVDTTLAGLPAAVEQSAPQGEFGRVLAGVQEMLVRGPQAGGSGGAGASATGRLATAGVGSALAVPNASGLGSVASADAERYLGVPYQWGGTSPSGFDCSGLVQYVYGQLGVSLPRTSQEQATVGTAVPDLAAAQPGDLVFFPGTDGTASAPGHVGIYLGGGMMIDAPHTGASVRIEPVGQPVAIRRVVPSGAAGTVSWGSAVAGAGVAPGGASASGAVPASLAPLFVSAAGKYGVPATLLAAVARQESGFDTAAVSSAGAEGLMQLMPQTAAGLGVNPFDPAQAIDGAAQLLAGYLQQFGSVPLALAAYNAGPGAVEQYGGIPPYAQTQQYVASIMSQLGSAA